MFVLDFVQQALFIIVSKVRPLSGGLQWTLKSLLIPYAIAIMLQLPTYTIYTAALLLWPVANLSQNLEIQIRSQCHQNCLYIIHGFLHQFMHGSISFSNVPEAKMIEWRATKMLPTYTHPEVNLHVFTDHQRKLGMYKCWLAWDTCGMIWGTNPY